MSFVYVLFALLLLVFNVWSVYNFPVVLAGVRDLLRVEKRNRARSGDDEALLDWDVGSLPFVSVVVPVKNEERVVDRLLRALVNLRYPKSRLEIIVVNDESCDRTGMICGDYGFRFPFVRVFNRVRSSTKAAALNFGVGHARGEIVCTFDADSVPEPDAVLKAVRYFRDPGVAAVQGRICCINERENMLTRFLSYEGAVQYEAYLRGKDRLSLFVGLAGTCQFVRRSVLEAVGGWDEDNLSEDVELSLRLTDQDHAIRYASDVRTWEESPNSVGGLVRQRARWFRGNIEMGFRFGRLLRRLSFRRFDAEMSLLGSYLVVLCVVSYFMAVWSFLLPPFDVLIWVTRFTSLFTVVILALVGVALVYVSRPLRLVNLLWLPFIYAYWGFQSLIALYAVVLIVLRRPGRWSKTLRSGVVTSEQAREILDSC